MRRIIDATYYRLFTIYQYFYIKYFEKQGSSFSRLEVKSQENVIVSFTTIPKRLSKVPLVVKSILHQSVLPNRIIMYVYEGDFKDINLEEILKLEISLGLEIVYLKENLRSHKKYYYAMLDFKDDIIITIDDDIIYPRNMIRNLLYSYKKNPYCISAQRCHEMLFQNNGILQNYNVWKYEIWGGQKPSQKFFFTSGGGTLFPPTFRDEEMFNKINIRKLSFLADDVWLNMMAYKNGFKVVKSTMYRGTPVTIDDDIENSLAYQNVIEGNNNDVCIKNMIDYYHLDFSGEE